ncbi:type II toxin-antitoxin system YafO family toxin [Shewanella sp. SR43-8]|uniref:type II toxin-antitoxin system YafO family toxin n=1 Tax=Shewanella sp. SR43-8 TaxID=2760938 RepID=UPI00160278E0|nr:type II toxin-antitoxin system YafO family toxin [Shewanella sp. SR43-8]MBB1322111.1 type II toxin-antitoxin system YafO family toxin [Shewanella sp. SR43-8]
MGRGIKVFKTEWPIWNTPTIKPIVDQFKQYKLNRNTPVTFGRDAPLVRPSDAKFAGLHHVHLGSFNAITYQYSRTSDDWLIYATGFINHDHFLLIDILAPDAHNKAENIDLMNRYIQIANKFREEH